MSIKRAMFKKSKLFMIVFAICTVLVLIMFNSIFETVNKGTYHVIQRPITGTLEAKLKTGMYLQLFSDVDIWPKTATYFFTEDTEEGGDFDQSIEVRFNDAAIANISGTALITLPTGETAAISLVDRLNFRSFDDMLERLIKPHVRNALRTTANLMDSRGSYAEKRPDFVEWAKDMVQNGIYQTEEKVQDVYDASTGTMIQKRIKIIRIDSVTSEPLRVPNANPLKDTGITITNFEVKKFVYNDAVRTQIEKQRENLMDIERKKTEAEKARQDAITAEELGKADVMKVRYAQLQEKEKATIEADKNKQVAETDALRELEVARLMRQAAVEIKQQQILLGQGEAERKRLVLNADGALAQKLSTYEKVMGVWAEAFSIRNVPAYVVSGGDGGNTDIQTQQFMNVLNAMMAKNLGLDLTIPKGKTTGGGK